MLDVTVSILLAIEILLMIFLVWRFIRLFVKYKYFGSTLYYIIPCYVLCLLFSIFVRLRPAEGLIEASSFPSGILNSFIDAAKMMFGGFDSEPITNYFALKQTWSTTFVVIYIIASIFSLVMASISVVTFSISTFDVKVKNYFGDKKKKNVSYIFTEAKVPFAVRFAQKLKEDGDIVRIVISRGSLKTQEGTEFKDSLSQQGFDVWSENLSSNFISLLLKRDWVKKQHKRVAIYGLYYDDNDSLDFASQVRESLHNHKEFKSIYDRIKKHSYSNVSEEELLYIERLKVFIKYEEFDPEILYRHMADTLGIINTISEYEMVSNNFVKNNPISNFIDLKQLASKETESKGLHVTFFGFGNVNRAIFKKLTAGYQLWGDGQHLVNYHVIDKNGLNSINDFNDIYSNKDVNEHYSQWDYLPIPHLYNISADEYVDLNNEKSVFNYINNLFFDKNLRPLPNRFEDDGFELFIVSITSSNMSAKIAYNLRRALISQIPEERLKKTAIFVRISENRATEDFVNANNFCFSQEEFMEGFKSRSYIDKGSPSCPIIAFGEDSIMSRYVNHDFYVENNIAVDMNNYYLRREGIIGLDAWISRLLANKENSVANKAPIWQLKAKLALLGYRLTDDLKVIDDNGNNIDADQFEKTINELFPEHYSDLSDIGRCLVEMEHNRWTATASLLYNYRPLDFKSFVENGFRTKDANASRHICMTTNQGLQELYSKVMQEFGEMDEKLKWKMNNIVYYSDTSALVFLLNILNK